MANPAVVVDFVANTKDLNRGFQDASKSASGFGSKVKGLALGAATAGFAALGATIKIGVDEFAEAQKVGAQTGAVIKSTGAAANVSAKQVETLAGSLMKKSGVDDEAIQSGENVLLTFTKIRNEAGKGNDVFNQTTKAALDMSVALGTDMKSASMQLGKALNDPIKGMTKLTRSGVTFTDAQVKQVAAMTKAGDVAGAQKIILAELNKEFGGSAEAAGKTLPGQLKILREQFSNLAGELVAKAIPVLTAVAKVLVDHKDAVIAVVAVLATLTAGVLTVKAATLAWNAAQVVAKAATVAWTTAQWLLNAALTANPIGLVVLAIAALVAALVLAYTKSETFRNLVTGAFDAIKDAAAAVLGWLKGNWPALLAILTGPIGVAAYLIGKHWDAIKTTVSSAVTLIKGWISEAWERIRQATLGAWGTVAAKVTGVIADIKQALSAFAGWITAFATGVWKVAVDKIAAVWGVIEHAARTAVSGVKDALNGMIDWIAGIVDRVKSVAADVANAIKKPINSVIRAWNSLQIPRLEVRLPKRKILGKTVGGGSFGFGPVEFPDIPQLAGGGIVSSPTLALIGEQGTEIVAPEKMLRDLVGERHVEVRVFIGDQELRDIVSAEVRSEGVRTARVLLSGAM